MNALLSRTYKLEYFDLHLLVTVLGITKDDDGSVLYQTRICDKEYSFKKTIGINDLTELDPMSLMPSEILSQLSDIFTCLEKNLTQAA